MAAQLGHLDKDLSTQRGTQEGAIFKETGLDRAVQLERGRNILIKVKDSEQVSQQLKVYVWGHSEEPKIWQATRNKGGQITLFIVTTCQLLRQGIGICNWESR